MNNAASLIVYGRTDGGYRRGAIVFAKNGQPKPGIMLISGSEVTATHTVYQIRRYADRKAIYTSVGTDYCTAQALLTRTKLTRKREAIDAQLGITMPKTDAELAAEKIAEAVERAAEEAERQRQRKTLAQYAEEFRAKKNGLSTDSVALVKDAVLPFIKFAGKTYLEDITGQHVADWYDSMRKAGYAVRTCQTRYTTVRGFLKGCGVNLAELIDESVHARLRRKPDACTEPYAQDEIDKLLSVCDSYYQLVFTVLLCTGMRYREANHLTWRQIKWDKNIIIVEGQQEIHHAKTGKIIPFSTKTGKGRMIPLFASLRVMLEDWRQQHPDTIYVLGTRRDLPDNHWLGKLKQFAREAGLNCGMCASCAKRGECEQFYLHKFRHSFAHRCLEQFSIHQVSKWLGHHDLQVTSIYLSGAPKDADCDPFAVTPPKKAAAHAA
jgi:integrase